MIYDTHITFETASLAKEKGFTLQTVGSHTYNYYENDGGDGYISWGHLHLDQPAKVPQSILQKWLRDVHKVHIEHNIEFNEFAFSVSGFKTITKMGRFDNYEVGLEQALQLALKLI